MSKTKLLVASVIALIVLNLGLMGAFFMVKGPPKGHKNHRQHKTTKIIERLNFDDAQTEQFLALVKEHRNSIDEINQKGNLIKKELYQDLTKNNLIRKNSLIKNLGDLQVQVETIHFNHFIDIKEICRPEQFADFEEFKEQLVHIFSKKKGGSPPPKNRRH